jgi:hypothetical protein
MYTYRMQARDKSPNQNATGWSTSQSATTPTGGDTTPPTPNPMTWATVPYATGTTSIAMVATTATDASGVQYFFDCTSTGGHDSAWQSGTSYTDTGLSPNTQYCYRVQARDLSPNQNATTWSSTLCATTQSGGGGTIFFDGFTDGDLVGWTTSGAVSVKSTGGVVGNYASLQATAWMEKAVSTAGYTSIHVKYYRWVASCNLYVEWWDGSSWNVLETSGSSGWTYMDMTCGSGANNNANFKIRFRTDGTRNNHSAKVDEIEITGTQ